MLRVRNLAAGYARHPVARLSSLDVQSGSCVLLLGPSGSGKTTLLLAMAGLAKVLSGSVEIDGEDFAQLPALARDRKRGTRIGLVFQDLHLIPGLSALDNVLLSPFAVNVPQDRERARDLLAALGLASKTKRMAETLSRGEAQRTAIARAMLLKPALILADEPTASLDDPTCATVADLLQRAAEETGAALVVATHDQRLRTRFPHTAIVESVS